MPTTQDLTDAELTSLIDNARKATGDGGAQISVSVVDRGGHLLGFFRGQDAVLISGETSTRKAYTSVQLNSATLDVVDAVKEGGPFHSLPTALDRPLLFIAGAIPLRRDGRLIGAIGIGGGAPEDDHAVAVRAATELSLTE